VSQPPLHLDEPPSMEDPRRTKPPRSLWDKRPPKEGTFEGAPAWKDPERRLGQDGARRDPTHRTPHTPARRTWGRRMIGENTGFAPRPFGRDSRVVLEQHPGSDFMLSCRGKRRWRCSSCPCMRGASGSTGREGEGGRRVVHCLRQRV
jgi:hypothetical protein